VGGTLVISLDFELHWGLRRSMPPRASDAWASAARWVVGELLRRFEDAGVAATWATVGFLFAANREELEAHAPRVRPVYASPGIDPYRREIGDGEGTDPAHYARSLIERIKATPRQEVATHTYSHFYCGENEGAHAAFDADLASAIAIAGSLGVRPRSIVFPANQVSRSYLDLLPKHGIRNYRGDSPRLSGDPHVDYGALAPAVRAMRLADAYLPLGGRLSYPEASVVERTGLANVRASMFLRVHAAREAALSGLHLRRVIGEMRRASEHGEIFHLWWHPHNFVVQPVRSLSVLAGIIQEFQRLRAEAGMRSSTMDELGRRLRSGASDDTRSSEGERPGAAAPPPP